MGLKNIIEVYKIMAEGTDFLLECKEKGVVRCDLEEGKYPKLRERFFELTEKGKNRREMVGSLDFKIAYLLHRIENGHKIKEAYEYGSQNIYSCDSCSIQDPEK